MQECIYICMCMCIKWLYWDYNTHSIKFSHLKYAPFGAYDSTVWAKCIVKGIVLISGRRLLELIEKKEGWVVGGEPSVKSRWPATYNGSVAQEPGDPKSEPQEKCIMALWMPEHYTLSMEREGGVEPFTASEWQVIASLLLESRSPSSSFSRSGKVGEDNRDGYIIVLNQ